MPQEVTPPAPQSTVGAARKAAVISAVKELARIAFLGALAAVLSYLTTQVANLPPDSAYAIVGTLVLKALDKFVHANQNNTYKGIVPF